MFHLIDPASWTTALDAGEVAAPSLDVEGFIHCSTKEQIVGTITRHFVDVDALLLLELDEHALGPKLRWEESRPGEVYPHLYRPIDVAEVHRVLSWQRDADGSVTLPPDL